MLLSHLSFIKLGKEYFYFKLDWVLYGLHMVYVILTVLMNIGFIKLYMCNYDYIFNSEVVLILYVVDRVIFEK